MRCVSLAATLCLFITVQMCFAEASQTARTTPYIETDVTFDADFFPILPWNQSSHRSKERAEPGGGVESIAACGFTIAGFVQPADLPACEKLGLKAIMGPPPGGPSWKRNRWKDVSDDEVAAYIRRLVESGGDSPAVIGYYIMDEPGAPAFPALGKAVAAVRKYAPGKLAYINLFPGYATIGAPDQSQLGTASFTEYLERYVAEVKPQFISYDNYMVQYSNDLEHPKQTAAYFRDLLEVRRVAIKHRLPFWNIVSSNQIRPFTPPPSPANLMLQAYTTLAAGGRGVSWYTYYARGYGYAPIDAQDRRTETWDYLQMINRQLRAIGPQMNRLRSTGVYFTTAGLMEGTPTLPGRIIEQVNATTSLRNESPPDNPLMIGEFTGQEGADYAMFVNLNLGASVNIKPKPVAPGAVMTVIPAAGAAPAVLDNEDKGYWLVPGQGVLVRLEGPGQP